MVREPMDVRCERCKAEYKLDETRIPSGGASVRCSACGHVFRVSKPGGGAEAGMPAGAAPPSRAAKEWRLRQADGRVTTFKETSTLQRWIVELKASREDELSADGVGWRKLGDIPQLAPSFARADELRAAGRVATPLETPTPVPGALTPPPDLRRGTLPFAGAGEVGARPPAAPPAAPAAPQPPAGWAEEVPGEGAESPLTRTGRQFPVPAPEEPAQEEGEATRVYDTSRLPPLAVPAEEEEAGTRFEPPPGLPPLAPPPAQAPLEPPAEAGPEAAALPPEWEGAPPPEWEEAPAMAGEEPGAYEESHAAPTEQLPARRQTPRWVVPAAVLGVLAAVAAVVAYSFWPQPTPPVRPRPGVPGGARATGPAGAGQADAGTRTGAKAALPAGAATAARSRADAGTPPPARAAAPQAAPTPPPAPAPAPRAPEAGVAQAPPDAGAPAEGKEMFERWLTFGDRRLKEGDSHKALRAYARAAAIDPASPEPYVRRGRAQLGLENPKGALTEFREALERDPEYGAALFGLAEANQALGDTAEARKAYQRYLEVLPRGPQAAEARARLGELEAKQ